VCSEHRHTSRASLDVDVHDGLGAIADSVEAAVAEDEAKLVFTLCMETAVTLRASRKSRALEAFLDLNFGMNFERNHKTPPQEWGTTIARASSSRGLQRKELQSIVRKRVGDLAQGSPENGA